MTDKPDNPNCLSEQELSTFADRALTGAARKRVEDHLAACPDCRKILEKISVLGPKPLKSLTLWTNGACPGPEQLGAWMEGALSKAEQREMDEHLAVCDWCRRLVRDFRNSEVEAIGASPSPEMIDLVKGLAHPADHAKQQVFTEHRPVHGPVSGFSWFLAGASIAAAAAFVAVFVIFGNGPSRPDHSGAAAEGKRPQRAAAGAPEKSPARPSVPHAFEPRPAQAGATPSGSNAAAGSLPDDPGSRPSVENTPVLPGGHGHENPAEEPDLPEIPDHPAVDAKPDPIPEPDQPDLRPDLTASSPGFEVSRFQPRLINSDAFGDLGSGLVHVRGNALALPREGLPPAAVNVSDDRLVVDADGDGVPETQITRKRPTAAIMVSWGGQQGRYFARFSQDKGLWFYRSNFCMAGRVGGQPLFLFDENGNGRFDDPGVDRIAYGSADSFTFVSPVMLIAGGLHEVRVSPAGDRVESRKYEGETGVLDLASGFHGRGRVGTAVITDGSTWLNVAAVQGPAPVPAGDYRLLCGLVQSQRMNVSFEGPEEAVIHVSASGPAFKPDWGGPLVIDFTYEADAAGVSLRMSDVIFTGLMGERYSHPNAQIARTKVLVRDAVTLKLLADPVLSIPVSGVRTGAAAPST